MTAWKRASELNPLGTEAPFNMAHLGLTRGERIDLEAAEKSIEQFLKLRGRDAEAIFLQGRIYERLGRLEDSQRLIASAVSLSPRLARWVNQPLTNFRRLRLQPNVTEIRIAPQASIWTEERLAAACPRPRHRGMAGCRSEIHRFPALWRSATGIAGNHSYISPVFGNTSDVCGSLREPEAE